MNRSIDKHGETERFVLDNKSGFVLDRETEEWLTTAEEVFDAMYPLLAERLAEGRGSATGY